MSRTTQQKVMGILQDAADDYKLDLVVDTKYANQGFARLETKDLTSEPVLTFGFNFQSDYWMFTAITPALDIEGASTLSSGQEVYVHPPYTHGCKPDDVLRAIRDHLARWSQAELEKSF